MKMLCGGILLAVGILIMGASGLCCGVFFLSALGSSGSGGATLLPVVLLFGGLPFAGGIGLVLGGRALIRSAREDRERY